MMTSHSNVSLMIMYEDESVDVHYVDGSQLHLSSCGSEFVLEKAPDPAAHPLQSSERFRQRTRFAISTYKELMVDALGFRNKYATRPYLPVELILDTRKKCFFSIDPWVEWPELASCDAELGPNGETIIRSVEGGACLTLSSSGEEFSVEFTCSLSQDQNQHHGTHSLSRDPDSRLVSQQHQHLSDLAGPRGMGDCPQTTDDEAKQVWVRGTRKKDTDKARSCSPESDNRSTLQHKPENIYQSTTVIQHYSCSCVAPMWRYPLSLACHHWTIRHSKPPGGLREGGAGDSGQRNRRINMTDPSSEERRSRPSEALPLRCPSPHQHRWKFKVLVVQGEQHSAQDLPAKLLKVMWCQGVIYRILGGAIPVIEVSPGDGSVIRSNGVLSSYFIHHTTEPCSGELKEVTYHLNSLPPDVPGQVYSVASIVNRASRILTCYNQARHSLKLPATPSCLEKETHSAEQVSFEQKVPSTESGHIMATQTVESRSMIVAAELEKIKRFNFQLENSNLLRTQKHSIELRCGSTEEESLNEPMNENCIADALQKTSKAIQDIDALLSATTLTRNSPS